MAEFYEKPMRLVQNEFLGLMPGGRMIRAFRGYKDPSKAVGDTYGGVSQIGSTLPMRNPGPNPHTGEAEIVLPDGRVHWLQEVIDMNPAKVLGEKHFAEFGNELMLLLKYLDSRGQLDLQGHPTDERAQTHFNSKVGKSECWFILDKREVSDEEGDVKEPPYVLMGFKEGIKREIFDDLYEKGDIAAMENWCHKYPVEKGQMYFVRSGAVHAVGVGCFILEIQQASNLIVFVKKNPNLVDGTPEAEAFKELHLGTYDYTGRSREENLPVYLVPRHIVQEDATGKEEYVVGSDQTPHFGGMVVTVCGPHKVWTNDFYSVNVVLEGEGIIRTKGGELEVRKADEFFLPAACEDVEFIPKEGTKMVVMRAVGPHVL